MSDVATRGADRIKGLSTTPGGDPGLAGVDANAGHGNLGIFRLVTTVITLILGAGVFTLSGDQAAGGASVRLSSRRGASPPLACCAWS